MEKVMTLEPGDVIDGYEIVEGNLSNWRHVVLGVELPPDAFMDDSDDPRYPAPTGYEWGEGIVVDGSQFVELIPLA